MKITPVLAVLVVVSLILAGCSRTPKSVARPTDTEIQDFKNGQAFAQSKYDDGKPSELDASAYSDFDDKFAGSGEFLNHSSMYALGAYYQECQNMRSPTDAYASSHTSSDNQVQVKLIKAMDNVAWARLSDAYKKSGLTYDQFAKLTGDTADDDQKLIENKPYDIRQ